MVNLLQIEMPPSARTIWASEAARTEWMPRIALAASAYSNLERQTVLQGVRRCMTTHLNPERMEYEMRAMMQQGLVFLPLRRVGTYTGFAHRHPPVVEGKPWTYYGVAGTKTADVEAFADATERSDHIAMGELLGYPGCCTRFFVDVWAKGYVDPIWQAACNTVNHATLTGENVMSVVGRPALWTALRYIGIRAVPHLVCSFDCPKSSDVACTWADMKTDGYDDLIKILDMPCEWSCLKGIALVTTPIFRVVTNSVPCYPRYIVRKNGGFVPKEGASGLVFPFHVPK